MSRHKLIIYNDGESGPMSFEEDQKDEILDFVREWLSGDISDRLVLKRASVSKERFEKIPEWQGY